MLTWIFAPHEQKGLRWSWSQSHKKSRVEQLLFYKIDQSDEHKKSRDYFKTLWLVDFVATLLR